MSTSCGANTAPSASIRAIRARACSCATPPVPRCSCDGQPDPAGSRRFLGRGDADGRDRLALSDDINGYAKISTGFKSGGFDGTATTNAAFQTPFDPETLTAYEIGLKSRFADDRVQLNMAYFYNDYKDFQANQFVAAVIGTVVVNAGDAEMQGAEIELLARPTANLDLTLNYGWLDTEYTSFLVGGVDVSDQREFAYSPENTVYQAVKYTFDPFSFGTLSLRADYSWKDDHFVSITDDPTTNIDAYGLINARAELAEIPVGNGSLRFAAWGKNLDDEEYWNTALNLGVLTVNQWADPRSYDEVGYEFSRAPTRRCPLPSGSGRGSGLLAGADVR